MKKIILFSIIGISLVFLAGCMMPQATTTFKFGPVEWQNAKDITCGSLNATVNKDGTMTLAITNLTTVINPNFVSAAGGADANSITAFFIGANNLLNTGAQIMGTGIKAAAK